MWYVLLLIYNQPFIKKMCQMNLLKSNRKNCGFVKKYLKSRNEYNSINSNEIVWQATNLKLT